MYDFVENIKVDDLDNESFNVFREKIKGKNCFGEDILNLSNKELLYKINLIENDKLKPAAILLFHKTPEKFFPGAYIKVKSSFDGSFEKQQDEVHNSLFMQADEIVNFLFGNYLYRKNNQNSFSRSLVENSIYYELAHKNFDLTLPFEIEVSDGVILIGAECAIYDSGEVTQLLVNKKYDSLNQDIERIFQMAGFK